MTHTVQALALPKVAFLVLLFTPAVSAQTVPTPREIAMGGTGTASAFPENAAFVNPALTRFRDEATGTTLVAPFASATFRDQDDLVSGLEAFQSSLDDLQDLVAAGDPNAASLRPFVASRLAELSSRAADMEMHGGLAVLIPNRDFTLTLSARTFADLRAFASVDPADITAIADVNGSLDDLNNIDSEAVVLAASVTEFGATLAFEGALNGRRISAGITPKAQWIETSNFVTSVRSFNDGDVLDDFRDEEFRASFNDYNVDFGLAYELEPGVTLGLAAVNLLEDEYTTVATAGRRYTYRVEPRPTFGVAVERAGFTFSTDLDLSKTTRFVEVGDSQFIRMGMEYNAGGWAQLRAGFSHDLQNTLQDLFTFGLGVGGSRAFGMNLVGQVGNGSVGAGLQLTWSL